MKQRLRLFISWVAQLTAVVLLCGTLGIGGLLLQEGWQAAQAPQWVATEATVVRMGPVLRARSRYYLDLTYEYTVAGQTYQAERTHFFEWLNFATEQELKTLQTAYPTGSKIPIFYNPAVPEQAVIDREFTGFDWAALLLALVCIVLPGMAMLCAPGYVVLQGWFTRPHGTH